MLDPLFEWFGRMLRGIAAWIRGLVRLALSPFRGLYVNYLMRALPPVARAVSSNPDSYVYLAESIRAWPDQKGLALRFVEAGWGRVEWHNLTGGIVALHHSVKPG